MGSENPQDVYKRQEQYLQHLICRCGEDVTERMIKTENMVTDKAADTGSQEELGAMMKAVVRLSLIHI